VPRGRGGRVAVKKRAQPAGHRLGISAFTDHDRNCMKFALENGVDAISQSFVNSADDVRAVRDAAAELGHQPFVIAKIERSNALDHLEEIIDAAEGIMIACGDLGVEVPIELIPVVQKRLMRLANMRAKPVITATQMLESMTLNRRPTRAEATCQRLQFSSGVCPVHETDHPEDWSAYVKKWVSDHGLSGDMVILAEGPSTKHPEANHRMEVIDLGR
jgi:pyruvate kinase